MPPTISLSTILFTSNLLTILLQLTKSEATSCNSFQDIFIGSFGCPNLQRVLTQKNAKVITKKYVYIFLNFHQVIYSLPSISCPTLELLALMDFEISSFLFQNLQRAITQKKMIFFNFHQVVYSLSSIR